MYNLKCEIEMWDNFDAIKIKEFLLKNSII